MIAADTNVLLRYLLRDDEDRTAGAGAGVADALMVYKALRAVSDADEALIAVYTFDAAMQRFAHTASL